MNPIHYSGSQSPDESFEPAQQTAGEWQRFLDTAVHDLRAPLRGIGTSAELLAQVCGEGLDEDGRRLIRTILDGVAKIEALSKGLSNFSRALRADGPPSGSIRIDSALRSALAELEGQIQQTGATVDYGPLPRVRGSHEQLSVLFRALISNALLYQGAKPPNIRITAQREGDLWRFAVEDNGAGIEPRYWDQIFQPFQRLHVNNHPAGAGLGLTICHKIVETHGGRIWVESKLQVGSTFFFTLPAETPNVEAASGGGS
jgi:light-regulated signal transduction histidine kinase (bacteriophytochrome)